MCTLLWCICTRTLYHKSKMYVFYISLLYFRHSLNLRLQSKVKMLSGYSFNIAETLYTAHWKCLTIINNKKYMFTSLEIANDILLQFIQKCSPKIPSCQNYLVPA